MSCSIIATEWHTTLVRSILQNANYVVAGCILPRVSSVTSLHAFHTVSSIVLDDIILTVFLLYSTCLGVEECIPLNLDSVDWS